MGTPGKERQKKYIERQRQMGKLTVTLLLSKAAKEVIDREQKKTKKTLSDIVEKALLSYDVTVKPKTASQSAPLPPLKQPQQKIHAKKKAKPATGDKAPAKQKKRKGSDNQSSFEF